MLPAPPFKINGESFSTLENENIAPPLVAPVAQNIDSSLVTAHARTHAFVAAFALHIGPASAAARALTIASPLVAARAHNDTAPVFVAALARHVDPVAAIAQNIGPPLVTARARDIALLRVADLAYNLAPPLVAACAHDRAPFNWLAYGCITPHPSGKNRTW